MYRVQIGDSIKTLEEAKSLGKKVKAAGFDSYIITETQEPVHVDSAPAPAPTPAPAQKSIEEVAREVINGDWGNGQERKDRLTAAGYDYSAVQKMVNKLLS